MTIINSKKIEIEIQEQKMKKPGTKYLVLVKTKNNELKIFSSNNKPNIRLTEDLGNIVKEKTISRNHLIEKVYPFHSFFL